MIPPINAPGALKTPTARGPTKFVWGPLTKAFVFLQNLGLVKIAQLTMIAKRVKDSLVLALSAKAHLEWAHSASNTSIAIPAFAI